MAESESPMPVDPADASAAPVAAPATPQPSGNVGVVIRALAVGYIMTVLGRKAGPVLLSGMSYVAGHSWFGRWMSGQALPALLLAGQALLAGAVVARVSGRKAVVGVAAFAALTVASGVPQLMTQLSNAAQDPRYSGGAGATASWIVIILFCVLLGGWLGARRPGTRTV